MLLEILCVLMPACILQGIHGALEDDPPAGCEGKDGYKASKCRGLNAEASQGATEREGSCD